MLVEGGKVVRKEINSDKIEMHTKISGSTKEKKKKGTKTIKEATQRRRKHDTVEHRKGGYWCWEGVCKGGRAGAMKGRNDSRNDSRSF